MVMIWDSIFHRSIGVLEDKHMMFSKNLWQVIPDVSALLVGIWGRSTFQVVPRKFRCGSTFAFLLPDSNEALRHRWMRFPCCIEKGPARSLAWHWQQLLLHLRVMPPFRYFLSKLKKYMPWFYQAPHLFGWGIPIHIANTCIAHILHWFALYIYINIIWLLWWYVYNIWST